MNEWIVCIGYNVQYWNVQYNNKKWRNLQGSFSSPQFLTSQNTYLALCFTASCKNSDSKFLPVINVAFTPTGLRLQHGISQRQLKVYTVH